MFYLGKIAVISCFCLVSLKAEASLENKVKGLIKRGETKVKTVKNKAEKKFYELEFKFRQAKADVEAIREYLDRDQNMAILSDEVTTGPVTVTQMQFNDSKKALIVKASDEVISSCEVNLDEAKCKTGASYFVVFGIKDKGPQIALGPIDGGASSINFSFTAPDKIGVYQIRFRVVEAKTEEEALFGWFNEAGNEPAANSTLALLIVR